MLKALLALCAYVVATAAIAYGLWRALRASPSRRSSAELDATLPAGSLITTRDHRLVVGPTKGRSAEEATFEVDDSETDSTDEV